MFAILAPMLMMTNTADDGRCLERHFRADGTVSERWIDDPGTTGTVSARSSSSGSTSASSSVSVSSSSTSSSDGVSAVATSDDGTRRTTMRRENGRCTIIIDERPRPSGDQP